MIKSHDMLMAAHARTATRLTAARRTRVFSCAALFAALLIAGTGCASTRSETAPPPASAPAPAPAAPVAAAPAPAEVAPLPGPFDWSDAVVYFAIVDRFADGDPSNNARADRGAKGAFHGGDLRGLTRQLDEIAGLGVNALWITPVVRNIDGFVTGAGFPDWGYHGYWADDFHSLDPRFGSEDDLRALVAECHRRGIRVLLDVVYNHAGYDSRYLEDPRTRNWFRSEGRGSCGDDDLTSCVSGLPDFKTELPEVAGYLMGAQLGWAKAAGLDGFRLDTVKHVDHPFWQEHRKRTRAELGQGFFLLGEVWGGDAQVLDPYFAGDELDGGFDFGFQGSALGFVKGRGRAVAFDRYLLSREKVRQGYFLCHFLSSHDVPGALFQLEGDKDLFRLAAVLQMTTRGIPMIYYGEEVGRPGGDWPDNRSDMPWGGKGILPGRDAPRDEALRAFYSDLIGIRKAHPALRRGAHAGLATEGDLYVYSRRDVASGDVVVVALNRGTAEASALVAAPAEWAGKEARDLLGAPRPLPTEDSKLRITVPPRSARILGLAPAAHALIAPPWAGRPAGERNGTWPASS